MSVEMTAAPRETPPMDPRAEFARLCAPLEKTPPAVKLRRALRGKFRLRARDPEASYLHTAGAYDAMTAAMLTDLGFGAVYANGWQLAATRALYPGGPQAAHLMADLVRELARGIESLRDRHFFDTGGEVKETPPILADLEACAGSPAHAFALTRELIRAGAAGICMEDSGNWLETLVAVKAAARAMESELVVVVRTAALDRAQRAAALGADVVCPEPGGTDLDGARRFASDLHKRHPEQILGLNLSPSLPWGEAKKRGALPANRELGELGYTLQVSTVFAFRTAGMALENWLRGYRHRGLEALADLQQVEVGSLEGEPSTRRQDQFAGSGRWGALERAARETARQYV